MKPNLLLFFLFFVCTVHGQTLFHEDSFNGGVTGSGYSPSHDGEGTGSIELFIEPGSTIRTAYLLAGRHGDAADITVTLNGDSYTFEAANQESLTFNDPIYGGASGVHAIDVSASIDPLILINTLEIPSQTPTSNRYTDYYLYVTYENVSLPLVNTEIFLNDKDIDVEIEYAAEDMEFELPIDTTCDVGIALFTGYVCDTGADGETAFINGTDIGLFGGNDLGSGYCGGPVGSFYYQNHLLNGLNDDVANATVSGSDVLFLADSYITDPPNFSLSFTGPNSNAIWAFFLTHSGGCDGIVEPPSVLGRDSIVCDQDSIVLDAGHPGAIYEWQDGSTEQTFTVRSSGRYWVTIDEDGLITSDTINIVFGIAPIIDLGEDIYRCRLDEPLTFDFSHRDVIYEWQDGSTESTYTIADEGLYWVEATDTISGCSTIDTLRIGLDILGLHVIAFNNPTCYGLADGSITVGTYGNSEECEFVWVPENIIGGATFNNLTEGEYTVIARDGDCIDSMTISLEWPDSLYADIEINDALCFGDSSGYVVVENVYNAQNDLDNIAYFWSPNFMGEEGAGVDSAYNMPIGEYTLLINDDNGCSYTIDFEINQPTEMKFAELGIEPAYCRLYNYQSGNGVVFASVNGGIPDYDYKWEYLEDGSFSNNSTWGSRNPGTYRITATDEHGCELIQIVELDSVSPIADFDVISDQLDHNLEGTELVEATFINTSKYFSNPRDPSTDTTFFWNLDEENADWQVSHSYFEEFDSSYVGEDIYNVCLVAINKNGCRDTTCKPLIVHVKPEFEAPNVFSPNQDGVNDIFTFEFKTYGIRDFKCVITNRWGVQVGEINDILEGWDGNNMYGAPCSPGVYFYSFEAVATNHTEFNGTGSVHLIRTE